LSQITDDAKKRLLVIRIPDTRGVTISAYGKGNLKIGLGVDTYSRLPGAVDNPALGITPSQRERGYGRYSAHGTCPGATEECQAICYAARPVTEDGIVFQMWDRNSQTEEVPPIPDDCTLLRIHVSGDFTSNQYIRSWIRRLEERPDVTAWAYTRSWRVPELRAMLELLRALPNFTLFASMDRSTQEVPPSGWRVAWLAGDERGEAKALSTENFITITGAPSYACPEESGRRQNCVACAYCFKGDRGDVRFSVH